MRLQRSAGNRATARLLARYPDATAAKTDLSLDDTQLALALTGMSLPELETFKNDVGGAPRLKQLVVDGQLTGETLKYFGAALLKDLEVDDNAMHHLIPPMPQHGPPAALQDRFSGKEGVSGMHDEAEFRDFLLSGQFHGAGGVDRTVVEEYKDAKKKTKYRPVVPSATSPGHGRIDAETPHPSHPDIRELKYSVYNLSQPGDILLANDPDPKKPASMFKKTEYKKSVITNLRANSAAWKAAANEALFEALRSKRLLGVTIVDFPTKGGRLQGVASNGVKFEFWVRSGKVQTCYPLMT